MSEIVNTPGSEILPGSIPAIAASRRSIRERLAAMREALQPSPRVRRAAGLGATVVPLVFAFLIGLQVRSEWGLPVTVIGAMLLMTLALLLVAGVLWLLARFLHWAPRFIGWLGTATAVAVMLLVMAGTGLPPVAVAVVGVVLLGCFIGAYIAIMTNRELRGGRSRRVLLTLAAAGAAALVVMLGSWLAQPGFGEPPVQSAPAVAAAPIGEPDPSQAGPYSVRTLTYGSGTDRHRPEFGANVALRTASVDARPFVKGLTGYPDSVRRNYWGFGPEAFPLNARVWYPEGSGPFPLVLVVHGNYDMGSSSDRGFDWLGELLASRGMIVASVDQNFLNMTFLAGGVPRDNAARAWMMLEHLRLWRGWTASGGNPFHGRVDLDRIALIGHSRAGEAVAIAAAFNKLGYYPDDARLEFDYGFPIRAVVAISPTDSQYNPADRPVALENVDYLVLHGAHDSDIAQFLGDRQYNRVRFTGEGDWFKASVYIHRANHAQFNTVWRRTDQPAPLGWFLDLQPLLTGEEQRRVAAVSISGFLEAALRDRRGYRALFHDDMAAAAPWLPRTTYVTRHEESSFQLLADYEEDADVTTTSAPGGVLRGVGFSLWREKALRRKQSVYLGWKPGGGAPTYALTLPDGFASAAKLDGAARLILDIAELDENPDPDAGGRRVRRKEPLDFTVELRDQNGKVARLPVSRFGGVLLPKKPRYTKWAVLEQLYGTKAEPVFKTLALPLGDFAAAAPGFAPADLLSITIAFDRSDRGVVALNRVGFAR